MCACVSALDAEDIIKPKHIRAPLTPFRAAAPPSSSNSMLHRVFHSKTALLVGPLQMPGSCPQPWPKKWDGKTCPEGWYHAADMITSSPSEAHAMTSTFPTTGFGMTTAGEPWWRREASERMVLSPTVSQVGGTRSTFTGDVIVQVDSRTLAPIAVYKVGAADNSYLRLE